MTTNYTSYSLLNYRATPAAPAAPLVAGKGAKAALKSVRTEAQELLKSYTTPVAAAPAPALTASPVGVYRAGGFWQMPNLQPLVDLAKQLIAKLNALMAPVAQPGAPSQPNPAPPPTAPTRKTEFVISSFNVLGSSHTKPGSDRPGMDSGVVRIRRAAELLKKHKVDVVGFQEFQDDQMKEFMRVTKGEYGVATGKIGKKKDTDNTLAWRKDTWELVKADSIAIPYFHGHVREMPLVRLRNKKTGQEAYFANFHNPASTKRVGDQERFRDEAMKRQIAMVNKLTRETGLPVFVTGDMNEREEYYNGMTKGAPMVSADRPKGGPAPKKPGIDWIFGTKGVTFSDYVRDRGALVQKTTDHPMIVSKARIG